MSVKNLLPCILLLCATTPFATGEWIVEFPGLPKLIERSDAIVILRVDRNVEAESRIRVGLYRTYECYIYQALKGNLPSQVRLRLMDTRLGFVTPYAVGSAHLMFLAKARGTDEPTEYRTIEVEGANIRLSPFGHEEMPEGKTLVERIQTLIAKTIQYSQKEELKEREFLDRVRVK
jgi:hypothetical protein